MAVRWTDAAALDLDWIQMWIHADDPDAAERVIFQLIDAVERLAEFPLLGRDGREEGSREWSVPRLPYIIAYRIENDDGLTILRVLHGAMKWPEP